MKHLVICAALVAACPAHALEQHRGHKPKSFAGIACTTTKAAKTFVQLLRAEGDIAKAFASSDKGTFASCNVQRVVGQQVGASIIEVVAIRGVMHRMQVTSVTAQGKTIFVIRCDRLPGLVAI